MISIIGIWVGYIDSFLACPRSTFTNCQTPASFSWHFHSHIQQNIELVPMQIEPTQNIPCVPPSSRHSHISPTNPRWIACSFENPYISSMRAESSARATSSSMRKTWKSPSQKLSLHCKSLTCWEFTVFRLNDFLEMKLRLPSTLDQTESIIRKTKNFTIDRLIQTPTVTFDTRHGSSIFHTPHDLWRFDAPINVNRVSLSTLIWKATVYPWFCINGKWQMSFLNDDGSMCDIKNTSK